MLSDMLREGTCQSLIMTAGGISATAARSVNPARDVMPEM